MSYEFRAMGTDWWVSSDVPRAHDEVERLVGDIEERLSRFRAGSALSRLNRERRAADAMLAEVLRVALQLRSQTAGAFDPTFGRELGEFGYDRTFEEVDRPQQGRGSETRTPLRVHIDQSRIELEGEGDVDLGGIAKGWAVDRAAELLAARGATQALVDGGGDIRGFGRPWPIGLPHGDTVTLCGNAVATSSTKKRRWRSSGGEALHHIVDPRTGRPTTHGFDTVTILAPDAATADGLATAVLVAPDVVIDRISGLGATALIRDVDGRWWTAPTPRERA